jgi:hypothetical protein
MNVHSLITTCLVFFIFYELFVMEELYAPESIPENQGINFIRGG